MLILLRRPELCLGDLHLVEEDVSGILRNPAQGWCRGRRAAARKFP